MRAAPRAEFPHYSNEERASAFVLGYYAARDGKPRVFNPYSDLQGSLKEAWRAGPKHADDVKKKPNENGEYLLRPKLRVTWREAAAWARRTA